MKKFLIVCEHSGAFYEKYLVQLVKSLQEIDVEVLLMLGKSMNLNIQVPLIENKEFRYLSSNYDEHRFLEVFREAKNNKITHIHFCRLLDPQRLYIAIMTTKVTFDFTISFGIFGLAEYMRRSIYSKYMEKLLKIDFIKSVLLHSIDPKVTAKVCSSKGFFQSDKVNFIFDPIYENPNNYNMSTEHAKKLLKLKNKGTIVLFFGSYFYSKGPDLLLKAAEELAHFEDLNFIFIGNTKTASFDFQISDYSGLKNVSFIDNFVDDQTAINYMIASDLVALPYRKFYENDTSGVFVQSCLARTPLLVPDISPFKNVVEDFQVGTTFSCESVDSLKNEIINFHNSSQAISVSNYSKYINKLTSWTDIARLL